MMENINEDIADSEASDQTEICQATVKEESNEKLLEKEYSEGVVQKGDEDAFELFMRRISTPFIESGIEGSDIKDDYSDPLDDRVSGEGPVQSQVSNQVMDKSCNEEPDTLSDTPNIVEVDNAVWTFTFLPKGKKFGPYPYQTSRAMSSATLADGEADWTSSLRESSESEKHNIEIVRFGKQIYYRTVTDIQPSTELVLGSMTNRKSHTNTEEKNVKPPEKKKRSRKRSKSPNICHECGKYFTNEANLKKHKLTHTGEKPHECHECGRYFSEKSNLSRHLLTHTGEKRFKCSDCDKCFSLHCNLKQHEMTHTGEKPHKCQECGKGFSVKSHLRRHTEKHGRDKKYKRR